MPYIKKEDRIRLGNIAHGLSELDGRTVKVGDLNYLVSRIVHIWLMHNGLSYTNVNSVIGVLECLKLELYRQVAAPYEDTKKKENGSVSDLDLDLDKKP